MCILSLVNILWHEEQKVWTGPRCPVTTTGLMRTIVVCMFAAIKTSLISYILLMATQSQQSSGIYYVIIISKNLIYIVTYYMIVTCYDFTIILSIFQIHVVYIFQNHVSETTMCEMHFVLLTNSYNSSVVFILLSCIDESGSSFREINTICWYQWTSWLVTPSIISHFNSPDIQSVIHLFKWPNSYILS